MRVGDLTLGEPFARVEREYGSVDHGFHVIQRYPGAIQGYYVLHGSRVIVEDRLGRLNEIDIATPYYRTKGGFGVGSSAPPLGRCHVVAHNRCEHRWRGFVYYPRWKDSRCDCWVKVGLASRSLPMAFGRPWFFVFTHRGRVIELYFARKYFD